VKQQELIMRQVLELRPPNPVYLTPYTCHLIACCKNFVLVYKWGGIANCP